jgi:predicted esterase
MAARRSAWIACLLSLAGAAAAEAQQRVEKRIPGHDQAVLAFIPNHPAPGLILALHGTGGSGPRFAGAFPAQQIAAAGYIIAFPTSLQGAWGTQATGGTPEGRKKDTAFVTAIVETFLKEHNVHPDKIHLIGYSAGSMFSSSTVAWGDAFQGIRIRSVCAHSGGFTNKSHARADRAKETSVWVLNGSRDTAHDAPARNMYEAFKEAGYDAKFQEIPGAGHSFPLVPMAQILKWWQELDKDAPDYSRIQGSLKRGNDELKRENYGAAYRHFSDAKEAAGPAEKLAAQAEEGLAKVAAAAKGALEDAKAQVEENPAQAKKLLRDMLKRFARTPYADGAKAALDAID